MNAIAKAEPAASTELEVFGAASVFDVARYEQVDRVASVMAAATLIPDHLKGQDYAQTKGNCFMICNLAANWELDPFAVAQASALVFGKIVLEGKLVRAVIKRHIGVDLHYRFFDEGKDSERVYVAEGPLTDGDGEPLSEDAIKDLIERDHRITPGAFAKWHTRNKQGGVNDNWVKDRRKMMRERGAREWCREFEPGLMLGVYTIDEFDDVEHTSRSNRARDITPVVRGNPLLEETRQRPMETIDRETGEVIEVTKTEAQSASPVSETMGGRKATADARTAAPASEKPSSGPSPSADGDDGRAGAADAARTQGNQPQNSSPAANSGDDVGGGESASSFVRVSAATLLEISTKLARFTSKESVQKGFTELCRTHGYTKQALSPDDAAFLRSIFDAHVSRTAGEATVEQCRAAIEAAITEQYPEDKL